MNTSGQRANYCDACQMGFRSRADLMLHLSASAHPYQCPNCLRMFGTQDALQRHFLAKPSHGSLQQSAATAPAEGVGVAATSVTARCEPCKRSFIDQKALSEHLQNHSAHQVAHSSIQRIPSTPHRLRCAPCEKSFIDDRALSEHLRYSSAHKAAPSAPREISSTSRSIHCQPCDRFFIDQQGLSEHLRCAAAHRTTSAASATVPSQARSLRCDPCNRSFLDQQGLSEHLKYASAHRTTHSGNQNIPAIASSIRCEPCHKTFIDRKGLSEHLQYARAHRINPSPGTQLERHSTPSISARLSIPPAHPPPDTAGPTHFIGEQIEQGMGTSSIISKREFEENFQDIRWSTIPIPERVGVLAILRWNCHRVDVLRSNNYHPTLYTKEQIYERLWCRRCGGMQNFVQDRSCLYHPQPRQKSSPNQPPPCCGLPSTGCTVSFEHDFRDAKVAKYQDFAAPPRADSHVPKRQAVTLDCEMVSVGSTSEAIAICVIDFLTGETLINKFICPSDSVTSWRTAIHGITKKDVDTAISRGEALSSWLQARTLLYSLIDDSTILIGHALQYDLDVLHISHSRIIDSDILARNAVFVFKRQWGLQTLCEELLGISIRENREGVHNCKEDALATREVVLRCMMFPAELAEWAAGMRLEEQRVEEERKETKGKNRRKVGRGRNRNGNGNAKSAHSADEDEVENWADIAVDCGYPHPDTGYDPWSD